MGIGTNCTANGGDVNQEREGREEGGVHVEEGLPEELIVSEVGCWLVYFALHFVKLWTVERKNVQIGE